MNEQRFMEEFAKRMRQGLKYRRVDNRAMTQHRLAEETGIHYSQISRYARAKRMPSAAHAVAIARVLDVDVGWLLGANEYKMGQRGRQCERNNHQRYAEG